MISDQSVLALFLSNGNASSTDLCISIPNLCIILRYKSLSLLKIAMTPILFLKESSTHQLNNFSFTIPWVKEQSDTYTGYDSFKLSRDFQEVKNSLYWTHNFKSSMEWQIELRPCTKIFLSLINKSLSLIE